MATALVQSGVEIPPNALSGTCPSVLSEVETTLPGPAQARTQASEVEARKQALQEVYCATAEIIYKFIYFKVGSREDAEDLTSQVYIKAARSLDLSQDARTRLAWLYQVARTTVTDHWRCYYKDLAASLDELLDADLIDIPAEPICLGGHDRNECTRAVESAEAILSRLPEKYRQVLQLRFLHGYSAKDIAAVLGITEGAVRVIQHRAFQKAMKIVAELDGDDAAA